MKKANLKSIAIAATMALALQCGGVTSTFASPPDPKPTSISSTQEIDLEKLDFDLAQLLNRIRACHEEAFSLFQSSEIEEDCEFLQTLVFACADHICTLSSTLRTPHEELPTGFGLWLLRKSTQAIIYFESLVEDFKQNLDQ